MTQRERELKGEKKRAGEGWKSADGGGSNVRCNNMSDKGVRADTLVSSVHRAPMSSCLELFVFIMAALEQLSHKVGTKERRGKRRKGFACMVFLFP